MDFCSRLRVNFLVRNLSVNHAIKKCISVNLMQKHYMRKSSLLLTWWCFFLVVFFCNASLFLSSVLREYIFVVNLFCFSLCTIKCNGIYTAQKQYDCISFHRCYGSFRRSSIKLNIYTGIAPYFFLVALHVKSAGLQAVSNFVYRIWASCASWSKYY